MCLLWGTGGTVGMGANARSTVCLSVLPPSTGTAASRAKAPLLSAADDLSLFLVSDSNSLC